MAFGINHCRIFRSTYRELESCPEWFEPQQPLKML